MINIDAPQWPPLAMKYDAALMSAGGKICRVIFHESHKREESTPMNVCAGDDITPRDADVPAISLKPAPL